MASNNSSKTAHVLNLLTETDHTQEEGAAGRTPPAAPPAPPQLADNETVAATIRDALEEDLAAELGESPAEALPEEDFIPMQDFAPAVEPEATVDATPLEEAPAPEPEPQPEPRFTVRFTVKNVTKSQAKALREFLQQGGYNYE